MTNVQGNSAPDYVALGFDKIDRDLHFLIGCLSGALGELVSAESGQVHAGTRLDFRALSPYTSPMPVDLPLHQMTLPSKMELLEALWDDLSRSPDQLESPEWHKDILEERRQRLQSGEEVVSDWEAAKQDIRRRVS